MRVSYLILFAFTCSQALGQNNITGTVIDIRTNQPIVVREESKFFLIGKKLISIKIDSTGHFRIDESKLNGIGDTLSISIGTLGAHDYADFEMTNIPINRLQHAVNKIFVTKAYWIPSCGKDCFTVNNRRTYRKKSITIDNGIIKYVMRRTPTKRPSNHVLDPVKYTTDFTKDLL